MNQDELKAAIAEQEEHIKRQQSCQGMVGQAHAFRPHGKKEQGTIRRRLWSQCVVCGVTETARDYEIRQSVDSPQDVAAEGSS